MSYLDTRAVQAPIHPAAAITLPREYELRTGINAVMIHRWWVEHMKDRYHHWAGDAPR